MKGWRDEMHGGWKGYAYRHYVEPFVIVWRLIRRLIVKLLSH